MNRKKWLWGALTAALVFALALAACGGGGDEPSAVAPPAWFVGKWYDDPSTHNLTTLVYDVRADGKILNAAGQVEGIITKVEGSGFVLTCYF
jgi:hypothetical protein